jgi:polyhydroxyalkanoate synthesis regulator phasin
LISWKYSFEKVSKELELAKKKKQALDDLFNTGKISQSTYDDLNKSLSEAIAEIEARQKGLAEKMTAKITDLEQQIKTLEKFLANTEIEYVAGEIDGELRERESSALTLGLEAAKQQLDVIKEAVSDLFPEEARFVLPPPPAETVEQAGEETLETSVEPQIEAPVEVPEEVEPVAEEATYEQPMEELATEEAESLAETPVETSTEEESLPSSEESIEENVTAEVAETSEETEASETTENFEVAETEEAEEETPAEGFSSFQGGEETTLEGEETEE